MPRHLRCRRSRRPPNSRIIDDGPRALVALRVCQQKPLIDPEALISKMRDLGKGQAQRRLPVDEIGEPMTHQRQRLTESHREGRGRRLGSLTLRCSPPPAIPACPAAAARSVKSANSTRLAQKTGRMKRWLVHAIYRYLLCGTLHGICLSESRSTQKIPNRNGRVTRCGLCTRLPQKHADMQMYVRSAGRLAGKARAAAEPRKHSTSACVRLGNNESNKLSTGRL